jgi:acyl-CoA dehydrogenase
VIRGRIADLVIRYRVQELLGRRASEARSASRAPDPLGSLGKLMWTENMRAMSDVVSALLGPALVADTAEWGTFAWGEHVLGAPGYRIAGGSDEIQRNIIGERVLGLPRGPA